MRILVADDDQTFSAMLCGILRTAGHTTVTAFDAMQTMMFAMRAPAPDLVLLDLSMPGGTGLEALKKLKTSTRTSQIPVVVISGNDHVAMQSQVRRLGAAAFLAKPVDPATLLRTVKEAWENPAGPPLDERESAG